MNKTLELSGAEVLLLKSTIKHVLEKSYNGKKESTPAMMLQLIFRKLNGGKDE